MKQLFITLVSVLSFWCLCVSSCVRLSMPVAGGGSSETVLGRVVDSIGRPAYGAKVILRRSDYVAKAAGLAKSTIDRGEALTDEQGRFEFKEVERGAYCIEANDPSAYSERGGAVLRACAFSHAGTADLGVATLRPYAAMRGTIDTAGRGARRLYVQVQGLERIAEIDANGTFAFGDLPAGVFDLHIGAFDTAAYPEKPLNGIPAVSGDTAMVTAMLPTPWQSTGIGETQRGSVALVNNQFVIAGGGPDIWGVSDGFHFAYQTRNGDVSITARVNSVENTDTNAKACVMIRESLSGSARNISMEMEPTGWAIFQWRNSLSDTTDYNDRGIPTVAFPQWIRLERKGDTLNGYNSGDGVNWILRGTRVLSLPPDIFVGLAVTSHDSTRLCSAVFDSVRISP